MPAGPPTARQDFRERPGGQAVRWLGDHHLHIVCASDKVLGLVFSLTLEPIWLRTILSTMGLYRGIPCALVANQSRGILRNRPRDMLAPICSHSPSGGTSLGPARQEAPATVYTNANDILNGAAQRARAIGA